MDWLLWGLTTMIVLIICGLFVDIVIRQKSIDVPCAGILIVDRQDREGPCMVYLQAIVDPGTFEENQMVKLKVKHVDPASQLKHV